MESTVDIYQTDFLNSLKASGNRVHHRIMFDNSSLCPPNSFVASILFPGRTTVISLNAINELIFIIGLHVTCVLSDINGNRIVTSRLGQSLSSITSVHCSNGHSPWAPLTRIVSREGRF